MFAIWLESLTSSRGNNVNNLDFACPQGWVRHQKQEIEEEM
jgi:hypothetical protein